LEAGLFALVSGVDLALGDEVEQVEELREADGGDSEPRISVSPSARSAATLKAMAMR
jgi:hypothetical protein